MINKKVVRRYHPGEYVKDALDALGMTSKEFSTRTGISERMLSGLITGNCNITFDIAYKLSLFFGNSIDFWTNLQNQYDIYLKEQEIQHSIQEDWILVKDVKKYLIEYGYVNQDDDNETIVYKARKIVGVNQLSFLNTKNMMVCFKEQKGSDTTNYFYQNFWIALALNQVRKNELRTYNRNRLFESLYKIRKFTNMKIEESYPQLVKLFSDSGISFALLPYLSKSNIYGATKWLGKDNVALLVSNRTDKADVFWFTICHELAHVIMEHKREALISFNDIEDKEADKIAEEILISSVEWDKFIAKDTFNEYTISSFAKKVGVHPCIVLGRLHKEKKVMYGSSLDKKFLINLNIKSILYNDKNI